MRTDSSIRASRRFWVDACSMIVSGVERTMWREEEEEVVEAKDWTLSVFCTRRRETVVVMGAL